MATKRTKAKRNRLSARRTAEMDTSGFRNTTIQVPEGTNFFVVKEGVHRFEILPYIVPDGAGNPDAEDGHEYFRRVFWAHRNVGPNRSRFVCPAQTAEKKCPLCDYRVELISQGGDKELIKSLVPQKRELFNIYDHAEPEKGVQVWDFSHFLFGKSLYAVILDADEEDDYEYFADREIGKTLKVGFVIDNTFSNPFWKARSVEFKKRKAPIPDKIFDAVHQLDSLLVIESYDKLKDLYFQSEAASSDNDNGKQETTDEGGKTDKPKTAADFGLEKGDEVLYQDETHTVFKISPDGTSLTLVDEDDELVKAVAVAEVEKVGEEPSPEPDEGKGDEPEKADDPDDWEN